MNTELVYNLMNTDAYPGPCQTSAMEPFPKIVQDVPKRSIIDD